jgi:hypothetical protein
MMKLLPTTHTYHAINPIGTSWYMRLIPQSGIFLILIKYKIENPENENENENETLSSQRKLFTVELISAVRDDLAFNGDPSRRYSLEAAVVSGHCGKQTCRLPVAVGDLVFLASQENKSDY